MSAKKIRGVFEKVPGSGVWWIQYFDSEGRRRREMAGTRSNAIQLRDIRKADAWTRKKLPDKLRAKVVTFGELAQAALEYSKNNKRDHRHDVSRMGNLLKEFAGKPAEGITPEDFERWLTRHDWKPATINRYKALISLTYRIGIKNKKVTANPARMVEHRKENNARVRWLRPQEEHDLRKVIMREWPDHLPEFEIALHTGMRAGEQYGLRWPDVDFRNRIATVARSKSGELRHVRLNTTAIAAFRQLREQDSARESVFVNVRPRHWFEPAVAEAGIRDFTWHCLRHTFASRLVMAGIPLRTVQELMGHKTIMMTARYAHLAPEHLARAVESLVTVQSKGRHPQGTPRATKSATRRGGQSVTH
jgi:site-specific recombinase XerD